MDKMYFIDTETCGLHGPIVLTQYAKDDGEIILYEVWKNPIRKTLQLFETFLESVCGFNLAFDWFHICQMYNTLRLCSDINDPPSITEYAMKEPEGIYGPCLKPYECLDLMLHARKGPYQSTMDRKDIRIKRVPTALAYKLARELNSRIELKDVYFARKKNPKSRWAVREYEEDGQIVKDFRHVVLKFAPSSALKALAQDALGEEKVVKFSEIDLPKAYMPVEYGYAPYAMAHGNTSNWNGTWPSVIHHHIRHWAQSESARGYARDDIVYTRGLYNHFGKPPVNDDDSILACMVGAVRWHGFKIDTDKLEELRKQKIESIQFARFNSGSSRSCKKYLDEVLGPTEKASILKGTKKIVLESLSKWKLGEVCDECNGYGCNSCVEGIKQTDKPHPVAVRAKEILSLRRAKKEIELLNKLLVAKRFHASFKVIGTLSSRMSGADDLNPQGINKGEQIRGCFTLADDGFDLCGGDFGGFEVTLMDAAYGDPVLHAELVAGKKIHALFGMMLFPPMTYEEILATSKLPEDKNKYGRAKNGVFALFYGGEGPTLVNRVGVDEKTANEAYMTWCAKYKKWGEERRKIINSFCSMSQPDGLGSRVVWTEPADYIESLFGFRRYFTLENRICRALFELAEDTPVEWNNLKIRVTRRDREQTAAGATRSALFGAAFAIQAANMRAAANHVIQSAGAQVTKALQVRLWNLQPCGVHDWVILPLNIHDEILAPTKREVKHETTRIVQEFLDEYRVKVPLLEMEWSENMESWASKG